MKEVSNFLKKAFFFCEKFRYQKGSNRIHIASVACGQQHSLAIDQNGMVYSWGYGSYGQLGHGTMENEKSPKLVKKMAGLNCVSIACGYWHSMFLTESGDVYTAGWNQFGQLGTRKSSIGSTETEEDDESNAAFPNLVDFKAGESKAMETDDDGDLSIIQIAAGSRHSVAISEDGRIWGWGWNKYGQLSEAGGQEMMQPEPQVISNLATEIQKPPPTWKECWLWCGPWSTWWMIPSIKSDHSKRRKLE